MTWRWRAFAGVSGVCMLVGASEAFIFFQQWKSYSKTFDALALELLVLGEMY